MRTSLSFVLLIFGISLIHSASASVISVNPKQDLQHQLDIAQAGDHIILDAGLYLGNFIINKSLELSGKQGAIIDGQAQGHSLEINAQNVVIQNLKIQNWGHNLTTLDAGVFVNTLAEQAIIKNNEFVGNSSGIWVDATPNIQILNNTIEGNEAVRSPDRGNGIHL
ncbi:MAG: copper-binding protein, partial [Methylophaga sp.]|nr:copper-binding protein [Methylophaga sp.]